MRIAMIGPLRARVTFWAWFKFQQGGPFLLSYIVVCHWWPKDQLYFIIIFRAFRGLRENTRAFWSAFRDSGGLQQVL